jgi:hypothetical protein
MIVLRVAVFVSISLASVSTAGARGQDVTLEANPREVTLGAQTGADVRALVAGSPVDRARWTSSIGRIEGGRFDPGDHHTPAYVIVAVAVPRGNEPEYRGAIVLELVGRGELATHTSPGAMVTVEIDDKRFGPLRADRDGNVSIPVEVRPGAARAKVLAVDRRGLETARERALPAAAWPRGLVIAPQRLARGETGLVTVFAIDDRGAWRRSRRAPVVAVSSPSLRVGPMRPAGAGRWDAEVSVPPDAKGGPVELTASVDGESVSAAMVDVTGPPAATASAPVTAIAAASSGARSDTILVGLHGGVAFADGESTCPIAAVDVVVPVRSVGPLRLDVSVSLAIAFGDGLNHQERKAEFTQFVADAGGRLRVPFGRRFFAEAGVGIGFGWTSVDVYKQNGDYQRNETDTEVVLYAALGAGARLGPGELVIAARWSEVTFDPLQKIVDGTSLGFTPTIGYRLVF